jgi:hypothetical protein
MQLAVRQKTTIDLYPGKTSTLQIHNRMEDRLANDEIQGVSIAGHENHKITFVVRRKLAPEALEEIKAKLLQMAKEENTKWGRELINNDKKRDKLVKAYKRLNIGHKPSNKDPLLQAVWLDLKVIFPIYEKEMRDEDADLSDVEYLLDDLNDAKKLFNAAKAKKEKKAEEIIWGMGSSIQELLNNTNKYFRAKELLQEMDEDFEMNLEFRTMA